MSNRVTYFSQDHLIDSQNKAEQTFMSDFNRQDYTIDNPYVIRNPYLINPLCALVMFKTKDSVQPTLTIRGKRNHSEDLVHTFPENTVHLLPVLGLYEDFSNRIVVSLPNTSGKEITIQTEKLPDGVNRCRRIRTSRRYLKDDFMFMAPANKSLPAAYDYKGEIRWLLTVNTMFDIKRVANGHILAGSNRICHPPYNVSGLIECNLLGKVYQEYRLPGNYHHDHFEMEDGNLLVLTQDFNRDTVEDMCVLLDRKTGEIIKTWDLRSIISRDVGGSGSQDTHDWFHANSVWYDWKTHSLTLSGRHQDAIVNIDFETGKLNWILGDPEGWPKEMVEKYFFTPVGELDKFDWQYEQHACMVCPNGDIMVFDNGQYRSKNKETYIPNQDNFSRGVRYRIDTTQMVIEQVWQYGKELGSVFFSPYISNVFFYNEGHYLIHSGGIAFKNGVASDRLGSYLDPNDPSVEIYSVTVEEKHGVVLYEMEMKGNIYRAKKLPLYHNGSNARLGKGRVLGRLGVTPEVDFVPVASDTGEQPDSHHNIIIREDIDRIEVCGKFRFGTPVFIRLQGENRCHYYSMDTHTVSHLDLRYGRFQNTDQKDFSFNINKEGLKGKLAIKIIADGKTFDTGIAIHCD